MAASAAASPVMRQPCLFLELPGEIRNRIYHFVLNDPSAWPPLPKFLIRQLPVKNPARPPGETTDWRGFQKIWRGLTQSCRQLRSEFLSTQVDHVFHIKLGELERYLLFLRLQQASVHPKPATMLPALATVRGSVEVHVTSSCGPDVTKAVLLVRWMPRMRIELSQCWPNGKGCARYLFNPVFADYVTAKVHSVEIMTSTVPHKFSGPVQRIRYAHIYGIQVTLKPEHSELWMENPYDPENRPYWPAWQAELGVVEGSGVSPATMKSET